MRLRILFLLILASAASPVYGMDNCFPGKKRVLSSPTGHEWTWTKRKSDRDPHRLLYRAAAVRSCCADCKRKGRERCASGLCFIDALNYFIFSCLCPSPRQALSSWLPLPHRLFAP